VFPPAGFSSSQPSSNHLANNAPSGFSTAWNSYESAFLQPLLSSLPQAQQSFVAHDVPVPSMVHNPDPYPIEYVCNIQSPTPCLANNVGVIGFCGPVLYDQGFQPGPPIIELPRNDCARYPEALERPSLESLLRESCQWRPRWKPFSESIPRYVEPVSYRRPDHLDAPSLDALLGDWKPVGITFFSPLKEVVEPVSEPTAEPLVIGDTWPVEERVPPRKDTRDAPAETTPEVPDGYHGRSSLERPVSDIGAATEATEATNLPPIKPTATICRLRKRRDYGPQGRDHPYPMHLRHRTAFGKAILIAQKARRKERQGSQLSPVNWEVEPTQPLEATQPLETTQPSEAKSWLKTTSDPTSKPKTKRRRIPGAWQGPLTPRTAGEERFYRFLSSVLRQIRHRVRTAFGEFDKVQKAANRPSSKHRLRTRIPA
jgi:hypothetical protein